MGVGQKNEGGAPGRLHRESGASEQPAVVDSAEKVGSQAAPLRVGEEARDPRIDGPAWHRRWGFQRQMEGVRAICRVWGDAPHLEAGWVGEQGRETRRLFDSSRSPMLRL